MSARPRGTRYIYHTTMAYRSFMRNGSLGVLASSKLVPLSKFKRTEKLSSSSNSMFCAISATAVGSAAHAVPRGAIRINNLVISSTPYMVKAYRVWLRANREGVSLSSVSPVASD